jgi:hypothetical protein
MLKNEQEKNLINKLKADLRKGINITVNEGALANYRCAECEGRSQPAAAAPQSNIPPQTQRKTTP